MTLTSIESFEFSRKRKAVYLTAGIVLLAVGGTALFFTLFDSAELPLRTRVQGRIVGVAGVSAGAFLLYNALRMRKLLATAGPDGLTFVAGKATQSCRWDEVTTVRELGAELDGTLYPLLAAIPQGKDLQFVVEYGIDKAIVLPSFIGNLRRLGTIIEQATLPHIYPRIHDAYEAQGELELGPVRVTKEGVDCFVGLACEQAVAFTEIRQIERNRASIVFRKKTAKKSLGLTIDDSPGVWTNEIPNPHAVVALVERKCEERSTL